MKDSMTIGRTFKDTQSASKIESNPISNLKILSSEIFGSNLKVCIVGNAGIDDVDDEYINSADVVVRFNNFATRKDIDHPTNRYRCDVLWTTFDLHSPAAGPKDVVIAIPLPLKSKEIPDKALKWYPNARFWLPNPYTYMTMCMDLGSLSLGYAHPFPSAGASALWNMKDWDAQFYVCGFSWYHNHSNNKFQDWDLRNKRYPSNWNHNYPLEIEWVIRNLMKKNNFIFSRRCNHILNLAKHFLSL